MVPDPVERPAPESIRAVDAFEMLRQASECFAARPPRYDAVLKLFERVLHATVVGESPRANAVAAAFIRSSHADALAALGREREACDWYRSALAVRTMTGIAEIYAEVAVRASLVEHYPSALAALRAPTVWNRWYSTPLRLAAYLLFCVRFMRRPHVIREYHRSRRQRRRTVSVPESASPRSPHRALA